MNRGIVASNIYLTLGQIVPSNLSDEEYERWQLSPDPLVSNNRFDEFCVGLEILIRDLEAFRDGTEDELMAIFYDAAKASFGAERSDIKEFFRYLYALLFQAEQGPRWANFVIAYGKENFISLVKIKMG